MTPDAWFVMNMFLTAINGVLYVLFLARTGSQVDRASRHADNARKFSQEAVEQIERTTVMIMAALKNSKAKVTFNIEIKSPYLTSTMTEQPKKDMN